MKEATIATSSTRFCRGVLGAISTASVMCDSLRPDPLLTSGPIGRNLQEEGHPGPPEGHSGPPLGSLTCLTNCRTSMKPRRA